CAAPPGKPASPTCGCRSATSKPPSPMKKRSRASTKSSPANPASPATLKAVSTACLASALQLAQQIALLSHLQNLPVGRRISLSTKNSKSGEELLVSWRTAKYLKFGKTDYMIVLSCSIATASSSKEMRMIQCSAGGNSTAN